MLDTMPEKRVTTWTPKRIRALRERLGLTQSEMAAKLCVSQSALASWERGATKASKQSALLLTLLHQKKL